MSIFTKVQIPSVKSSRFDLSHDHKLSLDMGELIPILTLDTLPGDKITINCQTMLRMAPLISPVMHKIKVKIDFFFTPNRMLWSNWEKWITGELEVEAPYCDQLNLVVDGTVGDYIGLPIGGGNNAGYDWNVLPIAAYFKIYDEYYRDENLQTEKFVALVDGNNATAYRPLTQGDPMIRAWRHDYFTSALPWAQKGDAVTLPLIADPSGEVDVVTKGAGNVTGHIVRGISDFVAATADDVVVAGVGEIHVGAQGEHTIDPDGDWKVQIEAEASTIETLRNAFTLQRFLELNARGGTRITEWIRAQFNVQTDDLRHDRPKYIGGTIQNMIISEVLATAETEGTANIPLGEMGGHGISVGGGKNFTYYCKEHGWIMGIMSVTPDTAYYQGLAKMFLRPTYLDYGIPAFANLGEQEIKNSEVYVGDETPTNLDLPFGYIPRYSEYKYRDSQISGAFKTTLNFWHLARIFATAPALNDEFIRCEPGKRIYAVSTGDEDSIYAHVFNNVSAIRKLPKYGIPKL